MPPRDHRCPERTGPARSRRCANYVGSFSDHRSGRHVAQDARRRCEHSNRDMTVQGNVRNASAAPARMRRGRAPGSRGEAPPGPHGCGGIGRRAGVSWPSPDGMACVRVSPPRGNRGERARTGRARTVRCQRTVTAMGARDRDSADVAVTGRDAHGWRESWTRPDAQACQQTRLRACLSTPTVDGNVVAVRSVGVRRHRPLSREVPKSTHA